MRHFCSIWQVAAPKCLPAIVIFPMEGRSVGLWRACLAKKGYNGAKSATGVDGLTIVRCTWWYGSALVLGFVPLGKLGYRCD